MREKVKDKGRLEHILQACNDLLASKDKYTFDAVKDNPIIFYGFVKLSEIIGEPTLKSKACFKWVQLIKMISVQNYRKFLKPPNVLHHFSHNICSPVYYIKMM